MKECRLTPEEGISGVGSHLKQAFAGQRIRLLGRRLFDADLDEMCRQFEELSMAIERARKAERGKEPVSDAKRATDTLEHSLDALRAEIEDRLIHPHRKKEERSK